VLPALTVLVHVAMLLGLRQVKRRSEGVLPTTKWSCWKNSCVSAGWGDDVAASSDLGHDDNLLTRQIELLDGLAEDDL